MLIEVAYTPITASASPPPSGPLGGTCPQANLAAYSRNGGANAGAAPGAEGWPCALALPANPVGQQCAQHHHQSLAHGHLHPPFRRELRKPAFFAAAPGN